MTHASWIHERCLEVLNKKVLYQVSNIALSLCKFCIIGRQRKAFSTSQYKTKSLLDLIHTNVWGPSPVASVRGAKYYVISIDDFSRRVWAYFLKQKSEVFQKFE